MPFQPHKDGGNGREDCEAALEPAIEDSAGVELAVELDTGANVEEGEEGGPETGGVVDWEDMEEDVVVGYLVSIGDC